MSVKKSEKQCFSEWCENVKMSKCQNVKKSNLHGKVGKVAFLGKCDFGRFSVFLGFLGFWVFLVFLGFSVDSMDSMSLNE